MFEWTLFYTHNIAWEGDLCELDFDACLELACFIGVDCVDAVAPDVGADCGDCPIGLTGDGSMCIGMYDDHVVLNPVPTHQVRNVSKC